MPKIPEYNRQFPYESLQVAGPRLKGFDVRTSPGMFGAESGRQLEKAGYMIQRGAAQMSGLYVDYSHTKATEAYNRFQESLTDDLYGEKGLFNSRGEAAMDAPAQAQALLEKRSREFAQGNELAQGFFEDYVGRFRRQLMPQVGRHATEQRNTWMLQTQEARAVTSFDMAMKNYTDPAAYRSHLAEGLDAIQKAGALAGLPPEAVRQRREAYISKGYSGLATAHIATGNYAAAEGLISSGTLSGVDAAKLQEHIASKKKADLQWSLTLKHEAERNAAKAFEDNLTQALEDGDMNRATQLAVNAPAGFKKEGFALIDHYARGQRVISDEAKVWEWQQLMVNDPEAFVKTWNPTQHLNTMDRGTRAKFTADWERLRSGDKLYQEQVVADAAILDDAYRAMGIRHPAKATGEDLQKILRFNHRFQEEVDTLAAEKKRKPTATEKMNLRDNMLVTLKESGGMLGFGTKKTFAFEVDEEPERPQGLPRAAAWDRQRGGWILNGRFLPASAVVRQ